MKVVVPTANPVLISFDTYGGTTAASSFQVVFGGPTVEGYSPGVGYAGPYAFSGVMTNYVLSMVTGRSGGLIDGRQDWALDFAVTQESVYGAGLGFYMTCADARAFSGISFWARGQTPGGMFSTSLVVADTVPTTTGGLCTGTSTTCVAPIATALALTTNWTQISLPWTMFTGGLAGGTAYAPNGNDLTGLLFNFSLTYAPVDAGADGAVIYGPVPANIDFQIDDIQFTP